MKGQDNVFKIKLACSRSPTKERKKMDGKKKRGAWFCYQWEGWGGTLDDTRLLKRLKKSKIVKDEFEKGCWLTSSKGTVQRQAGKGTADLWASGEDPRTAGPTRLTAECQETSQKTSGKLSALGEGGRGQGAQRKGLHTCEYCKPTRVSEKSVEIFRCK